MQKLSIIIPNSGTTNNLRTCIESVINQSYENIEVILIDGNKIDGNKDEKFEIISKEYMQKDKRIKYYKQEESKGIMQILLSGIKFATGDYITFLDSVNYVSIDLYRTCMYSAMKNKSDIVMGNIVQENKDSERTVYNLLNEPLKELNNEECFNEFFRQEGLNYSWKFLDNKIYSREICHKASQQLKSIEDQLITDETLAISTLLFYNAKKVNKVNNDNVFHYQETSEEDKKFESINKKINSLKVIFEFIENFLKKQGKLEKYSKNLQHWKDLYYQLLNKNIQKLSNSERASLESNLKSFNPKYQKVNDEMYFYAVKSVWNDNLEKIKVKICSKDIKCVSFDIFDTLIVRPFLYPTDLFTVIDKHFRELTHNKTALDFTKIRIASEAKAREIKNKNNSKVQDITLDEIYETIKSKYHLDKDLVEKLKNIEVEQEVRFCSRRMTGYELYELALAKGKKVICTSDMYLSKQDIEKILLKNKYDKLDKVYVSSEYEITKAVGDLYSFVLEDNQLQPKEMMHIGDNYHSDYLNAKKAGVVAAHLPKASDMFQDKAVTHNLTRMLTKSLPFWNDNANAMNFVGIRTMMAVAANKYFDNPYRSYNYESDFNSDPYLIGYYALGMYMFGLIKWILDDMQGKNYEKLVFMARDGYLPMECYKLMKKVYKEQPKEEYLYISRKALIPIIVQDEMDFYKLSETVNIEKHSPMDILKYTKTLINLDEEKLKEICKKEKIDIDEDFANMEEFNKFVEIVINNFYSKEKQAKNLSIFKKYFKNIYGTHSATFDIGYSARPSYFLSNLIEEPIDTYFCNINHCEAQRHAEMAGFKLKTFFDGKPSTTGHAYEMLLSALAPSCTGYEIREDKVVEVFEKYENTYAVEFAINTMQNAAIDFVRDIMQDFGENINLLYSQNYYTALPFMAYMNSSKEIDKMPFSSVIFEDNCGIGEPLKMVKNWTDDLRMKNQYEMNTLFDIESGVMEYTEKRELMYNSRVDLSQRNKIVRLIYYALFDRQTLKRRLSEITYKFRKRS